MRFLRPRGPLAGDPLAKPLPPTPFASGAAIAFGIGLHGERCSYTAILHAVERSEAEHVGEVQ
jgi:hypothetical protein